MKAFCMLLALLSLPLTSRRLDANPAKAGDLQARRDKLQKILDEEWEFQLRNHPIEATVFGDYRFNDKLDDLSPVGQARVAKELRAFQVRLQGIDTTGFAEQEQLNKTLLMRQNSDGLQEFELKNFEMPLDQFNGVHLAFAELPSIVPLDSTKHYEDYLSRLHAIPFALQQAVEAAELGEKDHLMPPKFLLEQVVTQCDSIATPAGKDNAFAVPLASFPKDMPQADQDRLRAAILNAIDTEVRPAYQRLSQFVKDVYAPKGRTEPGIWALPDGETRYQFAIHEMTTTDMTPQQVFDLGIQQVHEDEAQMDVLARQQGYSDWKAYDAVIRNDTKMHASSREQVLDTYRHFIAQMQPKLAELFGILPKAHLEIVPTEPYREKEAAGADYQVGTPDGSRPGQVHVNTYDYEHRLLPEMEDTAYHEGIPGHHMQLSIAQELPALPAFRQHAGYTAYVEGWALYSERLGKEIGFYTEPANDFERLGDDLLRATRLVEDSGVHYKHWTRDDMIKFFHENSIESETSIQAETDRYIAWPGQALGYKIGQLKFLELRKRAKDALGGKFDIRAFHDEMLDGGAMPLDVLDTRTNAWIESVKAGAVSGN